MKVTGIVLAAGRGTRIGADKNKMLLNLANKTPLELTLQSCRDAECLNEVILVCKESEREQMREIADAGRGSAAGARRAYAPAFGL